jgi:hypothetical protein
MLKKSTKVFKKKEKLWIYISQNLMKVTVIKIFMDFCLFQHGIFHTFKGQIFEVVNLKKLSVDDPSGLIPELRLSNFHFSKASSD